MDAILIVDDTKQLSAKAVTLLFNLSGENMSAWDHSSDYSHPHCLHKSVVCNRCDVASKAHMYRTRTISHF